MTELQSFILGGSCAISRLGASSGVRATRMSNLPELKVLRRGFLALVQFGPDKFKRREVPLAPDVRKRSFGFH